jgi:hypothetical protein
MSRNGFLFTAVLKSKKTANCTEQFRKFGVIGFSASNNVLEKIKNKRQWTKQFYSILK